MIYRKYKRLLKRIIKILKDTPLQVLVRLSLRMIQETPLKNGGRLGLPILKSYQLTQIVQSNIHIGQILMVRRTDYTHLWIEGQKTLHLVQAVLSAVRFHCRM